MCFQKTTSKNDFEKYFGNKVRQKKRKFLFYLFQTSIRPSQQERGLVDRKDNLIKNLSFETHLIKKVSKWLLDRTDLKSYPKLTQARR
jgi:hypothetical protein